MELPPKYSGPFGYRMIGVSVKLTQFQHLLLGTQILLAHPVAERTPPPKNIFVSGNRNTSLFCFLTAAQVGVDHCIKVGRSPVFHAGPPCHLTRIHIETGKQLFPGDIHSFLPVSTLRRKVWTGPEGKEKVHLLSLSQLVSVFQSVIC